MTTCLVPEGLPSAAPAEDAGGLATMEVGDSTFELYWHSRLSCWYVTKCAKQDAYGWGLETCLVPEGLPTAAAAEDAGGLATVEVGACY